MSRNIFIPPPEARLVPRHPAQLTIEKLLRVAPLGLRSGSISTGFILLSSDDAEKISGWKGLVTGNAQAACGFSFSASKLSPFFHRVSVIAAILRARVSRAIIGFMPLASSAW
jgi:hypothetical protein